ncbi:MAG: queuosine precursor transporter [Candidatus Yanofskybacteria bacterium]|nr:queuosine precursor transporter [Candidatus Yanofskybacteria bacterium]
MDISFNSKLYLLLGLFIGLIVGMNLLGSKIVGLFGLSVSVAIFMVPLTFLITDIVAEVYGKKLAKQFVLTAIATVVLVLLFMAVFIVLEPHPRFTFDEEYKTVFSVSARIMVASMIAFAFAQFHDIWAFEFWKRKTHGKYLWLRNNLSTAISQGIDTFVFMMIAFYQVTPQFDLFFILQLAFPYYLLKVGFAALDTPFVYLGVQWLKK